MPLSRLCKRCIVSSGGVTRSNTVSAVACVSLAASAITSGEAIEKSEIMRGLGVEFIEQPLARERLAEMGPVFEGSALPLVCVPADIDGKPWPEGKANRGCLRTRD